MSIITRPSQAWHCGNKKRKPFLSGKYLNYFKWERVCWLVDSIPECACCCAMNGDHARATWGLTAEVRMLKRTRCISRRSSQIFSTGDDLNRFWERWEWTANVSMLSLLKDSQLCFDTQCLYKRKLKRLEVCTFLLWFSGNELCSNMERYSNRKWERLGRVSFLMWQKRHGLCFGAECQCAGWREQTGSVIIVACI